MEDCETRDCLPDPTESDTISFHLNRNKIIHKGSSKDFKITFLDFNGNLAAEVMDYKSDKKKTIKKIKFLKKGYLLMKVEGNTGNENGDFNYEFKIRRSSL